MRQLESDVNTIVRSMSTSKRIALYSCDVEDLATVVDEQGEVIESREQH